jgi:hypothetical protein
MMTSSAYRVLSDRRVPIIRMTKNFTVIRGSAKVSVILTEATNDSKSFDLIPHQLIIALARFSRSS